MPDAGWSGDDLDMGIGRVSCEGRVLKVSFGGTDTGRRMQATRRNPCLKPSSENGQQPAAQGDSNSAEQIPHGLDGIVPADSTGHLTQRRMGGLVGGAQQHRCEHQSHDPNHLVCLHRCLLPSAISVQRGRSVGDRPSAGPDEPRATPASAPIPEQQRYNQLIALSASRRRPHREIHKGTLSAEIGEPVRLFIRFPVGRGCAARGC
jgi:hypothetical protein